MGNLFSKKDPPAPPPVTSNPIPYRPNPVPYRSNSPVIRPDPLLFRFDPVIIRPDPPIVRPEGTLIKPDPSLIIKCLEALPPDQLCLEMILEYRWNPRSIHPRTRPLEDASLEYLKVKQLFHATNKKCFHIVSIEKIYNPFIVIQYHTMKQYLMRRFNRVEEKLVFHGTNQINVWNIVNNNFNWRLRGTAKGHLFGHGVSFTPISNYATHYGDKSGIRVMFLVKMLVGNSTPGNKETIIPPIGYDTTYKPPKEHVYVKYDDNTFCPTHVIYYFENEYNPVVY